MTAVLSGSLSSIVRRMSSLEEAIHLKSGVRSLESQSPEATRPRLTLQPRSTDSGLPLRPPLLPDNQLGDGLQLHVGRALVDRADLGVAPELLDGVVLDE